MKQMVITTPDKTMMRPAYWVIRRAARIVETPFNNSERKLQFKIEENKKKATP
jgi:hypothetical protein